jgi:hypothetical protein
MAATTALTIVVAVAAAGCDTLSAQHRRTDSYSVTTPVRQIDIEVGAGTVTVTPGGSGIEVTEHQSYRGRAIKASHASSDGTLTLRYTCPSGDCGMDYDVRMPAATALRINDDTGDVKLSGLSGAVYVHDGTGDVDVSGLASGQVQLSDDTGDIVGHFTGAPARLSATADTGDVHLLVPAGTSYAVSAKAALGQAHVTVPVLAGASHSITARSDTGDVAIGTG